jgi:hypothetical protein
MVPFADDCCTMIGPFEHENPISWFVAADIGVGIRQDSGY